MGIIRVLLAISVVIAHSSPILGLSLVGGRIAVQSFYIISGFYMALILSEKYVGKNGKYSLFLSNRLLRLYPIYWVVLAGTIALYVFLEWYTDGAYATKLSFHQQHWDTLGIKGVFLIVVSNLLLFFQDVAMFLGVNPETGDLFFTAAFMSADTPFYKFLYLPQAWTLGIELMFYVIAPFIIRRKTWVIILLASMSLALRAYLYFGLTLNYDPWTHRFFPTELFFFLLGILAYRIYKVWGGLSRARLIGTWALGLVLLFTMLYSFVPSGIFQYPYFFLFFLGLPFIFELTKGWKFDRTIGELSYPIYICHLLVLEIMLAFVLPEIGGQGMMLSVLSLAVAIGLNFVIAQPIERLRQKRVSQRVTTK